MVCYRNISKFTVANLSAKIVRKYKIRKDLEPKDFKTCQIDELYPAPEGSSRLLIGCRRSDYSASRIARAVEDCDAHLLNLNTQTDPSGDFDLLVNLRINRRSGAAVARSLERYGYEVIGFETSDDTEADDSRLRERIDELLRYLDV